MEMSLSICILIQQYWASQVVLVVRNPRANAGDIRDVGSIPGSGRSSGGGHGNTLQYTCLENSMDRGPWQATVHRVAKNRTQLSDLANMHAQQYCLLFFSAMSQLLCFSYSLCIFKMYLIHKQKCPLNVKAEIFKFPLMLKIRCFRLTIA